MAFTRNGYGQVEPNQLSAQKTGQIYASLPLDAKVEVLQNGEFMYYDYAKNMVTAEPSVEGQEPMLVFNEIKLYEPFWQTSYKDFAMIRVGDNYVTSRLATAAYGDGSETKGINPTPAHSEYQAGYRMDGIAPRLFKTNVGDIMTTNMVEQIADADTKYQAGDILVPEAVEATAQRIKDQDGNPVTYKTLVLKKVSVLPAKGMAWVVAKQYTMPDGQDGVKIQRIQ